MMGCSLLAPSGMEVADVVRRLKKAGNRSISCLVVGSVMGIGMDVTLWVVIPTLPIDS